MRNGGFFIKFFIVLHQFFMLFVSIMPSYPCATQANLIRFAPLILNWFLLVASVENVELQCHVAKCELHDPIPAIDNGI